MQNFKNPVSRMQQISTEISQVSECRCWRFIASQYDSTVNALPPHCTFGRAKMPEESLRSMHVRKAKMTFCN